MTTKNPPKTSPLKPLIPLPTETQEAYKFATWCWMNPKTKGYLLHFANEGKRSASYGQRLKRMGMRPGTADYFLAIPSRNFPGMFIELKRADKKKSLVSQLQKIFLEDMRKQGFHCVVAFGADEAIRYVEEYLNLSVEKPEEPKPEKMIYAHTSW